VPAGLMPKGKVPWPLAVPAPGALNVMIVGCALAEAHSPRTKRARQSALAPFRRITGFVDMLNLLWECFLLARSFAHCCLRCGSKKPTPASRTGIRQEWLNTP